MNAKRTVMLFFVALLTAGVAFGADKAELKARFEKRYPQILDFKSAGKIGETTKGVLEAVDKKYLTDDALSKLLDDENADRKALYELIAKDEGVSVDTVAERTARRNYAKAKQGDYLKTADGQWKQK